MLSFTEIRNVIFEFFLTLYHCRAHFAMANQASLADRFTAAMVLSGVGDALGFKCGRWEFLKDGAMIHNEVDKLGGLANISVKSKSEYIKGVMTWAKVTSLICRF